WKGNSLLESA
ncbi:hypothetical protein CLOM_g18209, partial [Closterium sp. NIES-68]